MLEDSQDDYDVFMERLLNEEKEEREEVGRLTVEGVLSLKDILQNDAGFDEETSMDMMEIIIGEGVVCHPDDMSNVKENCLFWRCIYDKFIEEEIEVDKAKRLLLSVVKASLNPNISFRNEIHYILQKISLLLSE